MPATSPEIATRKRTPLWLYATLDIPYGVVTTGLFTTSISFLLRRAGMGIGEIASTVAMLQVPITFYFLYAPIVDFFFRRKVWAALVGSLAGVLAALGLMVMNTNLHLSVVLIFFASALATLVSAASGGMMGSLLSKEEKAKVGGWIQGGNLGAGSIAGGVILILAASHGNWLLAMVMLAGCIPTALTALAVHEPHREKHADKIGSTFAEMGRELRDMFFNWRNVPGMLVLASPIGTGAMQSLMGGLTAEYHASSTQLAFANGFGGGIATAVGSLCAILWPTRWNRMVPYMGSAVLYMVVVAAVAFGPVAPFMLVAGLIASNFATGLCYGCYTGVVLQTMGEGGRRQSTRYTLLNAIGNLPVVYMIYLCGRVADHFGPRFGPRVIAGFDAAMNLLAIAIFFLWWKSSGKRKDTHHLAMQEAVVID